MKKFFPGIVTLSVSVISLGFTSDGNFSIEKIASPVRYLSAAANPGDRTKNLTEQRLNEREGRTPTENGSVKIIRIMWDVVTTATMYRVEYGNNSELVYVNGGEFPVTNFDERFKITALDYDNKPVAEDLQVIMTEENPNRPRTLTEFDRMSYPPLYPVYSWIPTYGAHHFEIRLFRNGELCRQYATTAESRDDNYDFYDLEPVLDEGEYFWQVRAVAADGSPMSEWSAQNETNSFTVRHGVRFAALGDSITHGGGKVSVPPSNNIFSWEYYCGFPVKNLGKSGDTTGDILERFDRDVMAFKPEVLIIMAGVNDYRNGISSWTALDNLYEIRDKCTARGIKPVFITPTPINPDLMAKFEFIEKPPESWQRYWRHVCEKLRQQEYCIDIAESFADENGYLRADLTTDGLHPDVEGKKIIGRAVEEWLTRYVNEIGNK